MTYEPPHTRHTGRHQPRRRSAATTASHPPRHTTRRRSPGQVRRTRRIALLTLYTALGVELLAALLTSPVLEVKKVKVQGVGGLPAEESAATLQAAALPPRANWLRAPIRSTEAQLRALPWVHTAHIARRLPNTLEMTLTPRTPILQVQSGAARYEVDADSVPIRLARPEDAGRLPLVVLQRPCELRPGVALQETSVRTALQVTQTIGPQILVRIAKIEVDQSDNMCLNMQDGIRIQLGQEDELPAKIALVQRVYAREPDIARRLIAMDLSSPAWPACTPRVATPDPGLKPQDHRLPPDAAHRPTG